ncbi:MurR/RpiR family transcriptional regulator [Mesoplasma photuris]|uniref:MurR/RpiR family transcriptional regulator n=1 Tax=Mesoplasma photuris TaxID=217731 RepID=UPI0004E1EA92|nr:MurR/RpiR family transcriptional regulator [Mesoplasma photuris]
MKKSAYSFLINNKDNNELLTYINSLINDNLELNIEDIAKKSYMSKSGVTRFFKDYGFEGFKEFKYLLINETKQNKTSNETLLSEFDREVMLNPIELTAMINDDSVFEEAYNLLINAQNNFIVGIGGNHSVCYETKTRLERFGFKAEHNFDQHGMFISIANAKENDLVWAFSYTGESPEVLKLVKKAKDRGCKIISITRNDESTLTKMSDLIFKLDNSENLVRILSLKSRTAMTYIIYKMSWFIYRKNPEKYEQLLLNNVY